MEYNREADGRFAPKGTGDRTGGSSDFERGLRKGFGENEKKIAELKRQMSSETSFLKKLRLKNEILALEKGFSSSEEMENFRKKKAEEFLKEREERLKKIEQQQKEPDDYRMSHRPTESGITADDLTAQGNDISMPSDFYENIRKYATEEGSEESVRQLLSVRNKPNAKIKIYRATTGDTINNGDWVTPSREYAEIHNKSALKGKGKIIEIEVPVKDIQYAGDSINEWGYFPKNKMSK